MLIIATALASGMVTEWAFPPGSCVSLSHNFSTWQFLLLINVLLLVLGCFLEVTATLFLVLPILAPAWGRSASIPALLDHLHPQHGDRTGASTGGSQSLRAGDHLHGAKSARSSGAYCRLLILLLIVLGIITYVPILTLWLPDLLLGK